jgi:plastocyanin
MKKKLIVLVLVVLGLAASSVSAKTVTITITKAGYEPTTESIVTGDAVTFTNGDAVAHTVILKPATGFSCANSLALQPTASALCTFNTAAKYTVTDSANKTFKATITVTKAAAGVSLQPSQSTAAYGTRITLSGGLSSGQANQKVDVLEQACGQPAMKKIGTAATASGGSFTFSVQPSKNAAYEARYKTSTSSTVAEKLWPRVGLRKLARGKFTITVLAADSFAGKAVAFQRFVKSESRWVTVKTVFLKDGGKVTTPINPTVVSSITFRSRIKTRLSVRALLTQSQAGTCYLGTHSAVVRS